MIGATSARRAGCAGSFALAKCRLALLRQPFFRKGHQRDHALIGLPRVGAKTEDAMLDQHQAFDRGIRVEHLCRGFGETKARHDVGDVADPLAVNLAAQGFAIGLVGEREHRRRMGVVDEFVRNEGMQQRLHGRVRRHRIDQIGALQLHHLLVGQFFAGAELLQGRQPHRRQARGLDRAHVPAGALDAQHVDGVAVEIGQLRLHRGIAAAVQHQPRILAQQARGIDPERHIAAEVGIAGQRRIGIAIDPGTLHALASLAIRLRPRSVREMPPIARRDRA